MGYRPPSTWPKPKPKPKGLNQMNQYTHLIITKKFAYIEANTPEEAQAIINELTEEAYAETEQYEELIDEDGDIIHEA